MEDHGWLMLLRATIESALLIDVWVLVLLKILAEEDTYASRCLLRCSRLETFSYMLGDGASLGDKAWASSLLMPKRICEMSVTSCVL